MKPLDWHLLSIVRDRLGLPDHPDNEINSAIHCILFFATLGHELPLGFKVEILHLKRTLGLQTQTLGHE